METESVKNRDFSIIGNKTEDGVRFTLQGRIDYINASVLRHELDEALNGGQINIFLDMLRVEYLCSAGIGAILKAYKKAGKEGGKLIIEHPSENVMYVLRITSLDGMLVKQN